MPSLLHISVSARHGASYSRQVGQQLVDRLAATRPDLEIVRRDLVADPVPHPSETFAKAVLMPIESHGPAETAALTLSETLIEELEQAALLVIDTPIHNFTVPSALKAWIDQVVRIRRTFTSTPQGKVGLLADRPVYVVIACGGMFEGPAAQEDFFSPYMRYVLACIGLTSVNILRMEGLARQRSLKPLEEAEPWIAARLTEATANATGAG